MKKAVACLVFLLASRSLEAARQIPGGQVDVGRHPIDLVPDNLHQRSMEASDPNQR